jgi:hypothetical protein
MEDKDIYIEVIAASRRYIKHADETFGGHNRKAKIAIAKRLIRAARKDDEDPTIMLRNINNKVTPSV